MSIYVIFSGFMGAVLGAMIVIGVYWYSRYISTRRALADKLMILKHDLTWKVNPGEEFKAWDDSLKEILVLYNALSDFMPFWKGNGIQSAWEKYKGAIHIEDKNHELQIWDSKMGPKNKEEFLQNITSFLKALE